MQIIKKFVAHSFKSKKQSCNVPFIGLFYETEDGIQYSPSAEVSNECGIKWNNTILKDKNVLTLEKIAEVMLISPEKV